MSAALGAGACGGKDGGSGSDGGIGDDAGTALPLEDVEEASLRFWCETAITCDMFPGPLFQGSVQNCMDFLRVEAAGDFFARLVWSVDQGHIQYDEEAGARCFADWREMGCFTDAPWPDSCTEAFQGLLSNDEPCWLDEECSGGRCNSWDSCPGVCADAAPEGEPCDSFEENCEAGLFCVEDACVAYPGPLDLGTSCHTWPDWCTYPYHCDGQSLTCEERRPEGAACVWDDECQPELFCNSFFSGVCTVYQIVGDQGAPCEWSEGRFCDSSAGLVCVTDLSDDTGITCEPAAQPGEVCIDTQSMLSIPCAPLTNLYCDATSETCQAKKEPGEPCAGYEECISGWCDTVLGECMDSPVDCW
jgi:hypothetical protein